MAQETPEAKTRRELITPALIKAGWDKALTHIQKKNILQMAVLFRWGKKPSGKMA